VKSRRIPLDLRGLGGARQEIFRISGAVQRDPAVEFWFTVDPGELKILALKWFMSMRRCGADVTELIHDGCPVACVQDAPFGYVNVFKSHLNVGFFNGARLEDGARLLEGTGKHMRHVKSNAGKPVDSDALGELIRAAYLDIKVRLREGN
jgi:Domain of unknown function (DU1801)